MAVRGRHVSGKGAFQERPPVVLVYVRQVKDHPPLPLPPRSVQGAQKRVRLVNVIGNVHAGVYERTVGDGLIGQVSGELHSGLFAQSLLAGIGARGDRIVAARGNPVEELRVAGTWIVGREP